MVIVAAALSVAPAQANASEHVLDGSFEALTTCNAGDCTSPVWAESSSGGGTGPLCQSGTQNCGYFQAPAAVGPLTGTKWAQLGGESVIANPTYSISQPVNIPAGGATLSFQLSRKNSASTGTFNARIDGASVFTAGGADAGYTQVSADVSSLTGLRILSFEATIDNPLSGSTDSFNIDDVSLVDSPSQQTAPPPVATVPAAAIPIATRCPKGKKLKKGRCVRKRRKKRR